MTSVPSSLRLLGRPTSLENSDICGSYVHSGWNEGKAVYVKVGSSTALFFRGNCWVLDREGVRDSQLAVAWAKDNGNAAPLGLLWNVWKSSVKDFVSDQNLQALDAPDVTFISRRADISGEYVFAGVSEGFPYYANGDMLIRYHPEGRKWLVAGTEHKGNHCIAYAEAHETSHPGYGFLKWRVWDSAVGWNSDANCHCLAAPSVIHVLGRNAKACNARICGSYHLVGLREGRPLYLLPGKKAVIRYAPESDRWLIDFDALAEPGILGRLLQWAFTSDAAAEACSAYADARGSSHPGHVDLEWHVWENQQNRPVLDPCVRATSAPLKLHVSGRGSEQENGDICGEYFLVGLHKGWPAYQKKGSLMAIRREKSRWVIDREGLRDSLMCVAYAAATPGFQHAGDGGSQRWHVYESRSASHAVDLAIQVRVDEVSESSAKRQRTDPVATVATVATSQAHFGA